MSDSPKFLPFYVSPNLTEKRASVGEPWNFHPGPEVLAKIRSLPKTERRAWSTRAGTVWSCYTSVKALAPSLRLSKDNPPTAIHGFVADYDFKSSFEEVCRHIEQLPIELRPTFLEKSLGEKWRAIWVLERPLLCISYEHCTALLRALGKLFQAATLLAGFDEASYTPTQLWTNGCEWFDVSPTPVPWTVLTGVAADVSKKVSTGSTEIPIEKIAEEVKKRFPDRWIGEFKLDAQGVRFWDPAADCPTGCQVKETGMMCFTGNAPFVRWTEIFGAHWCAEQRALNLGKAAEAIYFTGREYWEFIDGQWLPSPRGDIVLRLKNRGLSDKTPKGMTVSDVERVLCHIQMQNRVNGAAPLINYPSGLVQLTGRRLLNTAYLTFPEYPADATGDFSQFPLIWEVLNTIFVQREGSKTHPRDHFLAWLQRGIRALRYHERLLLGQTVFLCGAKNAGKSLLGYQLLEPLLGGKSSNPIEYFKGQTTFSEDLLQSGLLMINDEAPPRNEGERSSFAHAMKGWVVNPTHTYHPKFMAKLDIPWNGRLFNSLNDDPLSVSLLPEVNENTADKMMFFLTQAFHRPWPADTETQFKQQVAYCGCWLDKVWKAPPEVLTDDRMGVVSYFDKELLEMSQTQLFSYNLIEFIKQWVKCCWQHDPEKKAGVWTGTPTELFTELGVHEILQPLMRDWSVPKMAKSLTMAARTPDSGIEFAGEGQRTFNIIRSKLNV